MDPAATDPLHALTAAPASRAARLRLGAGALVVLLLVALAGATLVTALSPAGTSGSISPVGPDGGPAAGGDATGLGAGAGAGADVDADADADADVDADVDAEFGEPGSGVSIDAGAGAGARAPRRVFVHVLGAVARPGLYELAESARVIDAIAAAGGLLGTADTSRVNLARRIGDGEQLYLLAVGEALPPGIPQPSSVVGGGADAGVPAPVNLNLATAAELDTLPRIGPTLAQRIIEWREANGGFTTVDDLLGVPGIGSAIVEGLRSLATV